MKKNIPFLLLTLAFYSNSNAEFYVGGSINIQQNTYNKNKALNLRAHNLLSSVTREWLVDTSTYNPKYEIVVGDDGRFYLFTEDGPDNGRFEVTDWPNSPSHGFSAITQLSTLVILSDNFFKGLATAEAKQQYLEVYNHATNSNIADNPSLIHVAAFNKVIKDYNQANNSDIRQIGTNDYQGTLLALLGLKLIVEGHKEEGATGYNFVMNEENKSAWEALVTSIVNETGKLHAELFPVVEPGKSIAKETIENKLFEDELFATKQKVSKTEFSASLFTGYVYRYNRFNFVTELGFDFIDSSVGSGKKSELEVKHNANFYLTEKFGYRVDKTNLAYITLGASLRIYEVLYNGQYSSFRVKDRIPHFIFGAGYEQLLNKNIGMFAELNQIVSFRKLKTKAGDLNFNSTQVRVGARYYFR